MRSLGVWLLVFAIGSWLLPRFGMQFVFLFWIYNWGPSVAMAIQLGLAGLGVAMIVWGTVRRRPVQA